MDFCHRSCFTPGEGKNEHPIEYASRLLSTAERNYSTTERGTLAIVWAVDKFRGYIEGSSVVLLTDHQPLRWLMILKSPTGRLARWALHFQPYNIKTEYTPGKTNAVADALSRPPCGEEAHVNCICTFQIGVPRKGENEIRNEQLQDPELEKIINSFETNSEDVTRWTQRGYLLNDGVLYCYSDTDTEDAQLVIPNHERLKILASYHDNPTAGHYGINRTIARTTSRYFWPGMRNQINKYVNNCTECQRYKASNKKPAGLLQTVPSGQRFEVLAFDLFGPLPMTSDGFQWILIAEDLASRWVELFPLKEATAENCAKMLIDEVFLR